MMNLPRIFGDKGAFYRAGRGNCSPRSTSRRALDSDAVRSAYDDLLVAQEDEKAATVDVGDALQAVEDATAYNKRHFPPMTQHDLWVENFGNEDQRRDLARRRASRG